MVPLLASVNAFLINKIRGADKEAARKGIAGLIEQSLGGDVVHLERETGHALSADKAARGTSQPSVSGQGPVGEGGKPVRWLQYDWPRRRTIGDCQWQSVHWRFYENGLVAFQADMSNASGGLDFGDVQGHRIEIRTADGYLIGAWVAAFFVRRDTLVRDFSSHMMEEHALLKVHFDDLAERQVGQWFHRG